MPTYQQGHNGALVTQGQIYRARARTRETQGFFRVRVRLGLFRWCTIDYFIKGNILLTFVRSHLASS